MLSKVYCYLFAHKFLSLLLFLKFLDMLELRVWQAFHLSKQMQEIGLHMSITFKKMCFTIYSA